ncbi:tetratricopeptide repeat protein [Defluviimonas sp. WL0050]|uniref:Tetratricopeptide repeat protein n=1 Tax=Albidovulum litorale TaxID=2984134 RepID=A0ABT2ZSE9_9RHOB|nr:tetratricopeptide repeat protein [Defluviimonas sp. WL0050]MCV2874089.1 tetratricopeptide repeat protein [Defluviimonas sp. WL0050]
MTHLRPLSLILALGLSLGTTAPVVARDGLAGPYLAGRLASRESDYRTAADFFIRALVSDPTNPALLENAVVAQIGRGTVEKALPSVEAMSKLGAKSQFADLVVLADFARKGEFEAAVAALESGRSSGPLVDGLYRAWALVGMGRMSEATVAFDEVANGQGTRIFGLYHKALALASVGDFEGADHIFSGEEGGPLRATKRGVIAHSQVLSQLERNTDAIELIDATFGEGGEATIADLRARLAAGETLPFTLVSGAAGGVAEVFYTVASALQVESTDHITLAYARMAEYVAPDDADAILLCAEILEAQGQYELATEAFDRIPRENPAFLSAELGRADALIAGDRVDAAIEVLKQLAKDHADRPDIWSALGDTYRRQERYGEAADAYDKAIGALTGEERGQWIVYYTRAIANERQKNWDKAEADFRKALELNPDQPSVLNYLGYSYLERKENYDEALSMIERAVAARPDDGAIVDSLGWALYRLGRYDEAVGHMEKAVELMPVDPVVNDHLGDVYWAVDRKREAEFQWKRALSFEPDTEEEAARIRRKLEVGLDVVLKEEGSEPLAVTKNGN